MGVKEGGGVKVQFFGKDGIAETSAKQVSGKVRQVCMDTLPPTLKIGASSTQSTRNHHFHERHQTFKSSEIDCNTFFLSTC